MTKILATEFPTTRFIPGGGLPVITSGGTSVADTLVAKIMLQARRQGVKVREVSVQDATPMPNTPGALPADLATDVELATHASDLLIHSSGLELAYAENISGVVQAMTAAAADVPGCTIVVPVSQRPVWVEAQGIFDITGTPAAGTTGTMQLSIMDGSAFVATAIASVEPGNTNGFFTVPVRGRLGPVTSPKTLRLQANRGGSTFAATLGNGNIDPVFKSYIAAFAA